VLDRRGLAPHALARWAAETPDVVALQHVDGERFTFDELHREALHWAGAFQSVGVTAGTHVATFLPNASIAHRSMLALGWLTAIEVPLNAAYQGRMLQYALDHSDSTVLVVANDFLDRVAAVSDAGETMPQKSTYFYPKLLTGVAFHSLVDVDR